MDIFQIGFLYFSQKIDTKLSLFPEIFFWKFYFYHEAYLFGGILKDTALCNCVKTKFVWLPQTFCLFLARRAGSKVQEKHSENVGNPSF